MYIVLSCVFTLFEMFKLMPQSRQVDPHQPWWLFLPRITHARLTAGSFVFTRMSLWFADNSQIDLLCISRELASKDTLHSGQPLNSALTRDSGSRSPFPPLLPAMLHSWGKSNFSPPAPVQKSTLCYTNAQQRRTPPWITAAVRLINMSEDKSPFFNPKGLISDLYFHHLFLQKVPLASFFSNRGLETTQLP